MAKKPNKSASGASIQKQNQYGTEFASETNAEEVKKQNQKAAQGQNQYNTEFASETDVQKVKEQNKKSKQNKK